VKEKLHQKQQLVSLKKKVLHKLKVKLLRQLLNRKNSNKTNV